MAGDRYPRAVRLLKGELQNVPNHRTISSIVLVVCSTALSYSASFVAFCRIPLSSFVIVPARRPLHLCFNRETTALCHKKREFSFGHFANQTREFLLAMGLHKAVSLLGHPLLLSVLIAAAIAQVCVLAFIRIGSFLFPIRNQVTFQWSILRYRQHRELPHVCMVTDSILVEPTPHLAYHTASLSQWCLQTFIGGEIRL